MPQTRTLNIRTNQAERTLILTLIATLFAVSTIATAGVQDTVVVGDGADYESISAAIDAIEVEDSSDGYIILVLPGTYFLDDLSIIAIEPLAGPLRIQAASGPGTVAIDGVGNYRCIQSEDVDLTLVDLTLQNGYASDHGAGIHCDGGSLTLQGVTLANCSAESHGGGLYAIWAAVEINDSEFDSCTSDGNGGGVHCEHEELTLTDTDFNNCSASSWGGALAHGDVFSAIGCNFNGNSAAESGAIHGSSQSTVTIDSCTFQENTALTGNCGGLFLADQCNYTVQYCVFSGNSSAGAGGALYAFGASGLLQHCTFEFNQSTTATAGAVVLYSYTSQDSIFLVENCSFDTNTAYGQAGAIKVHQLGSTLSLTIRDTVFEHNASNASTGGAIHAVSNGEIQTSIDVDACHFHDNTADDDGEAINLAGSSITLTISDTLMCDHAFQNEINGSYTDVGGNDLGGWCCPGDIDANESVDVQDLSTLLAAWGSTTDGNSPNDVDRDQSVMILDVIDMFRHWGPCG